MRVLSLINEQIELNLVPDFGCHWASLRYRLKKDWVDILYPVPDVHLLPQRPTYDGSYILAPWSNRIKEASFSFDGSSYRLRPNFPDGTAIHGDVWTRPWEVLKETPFEFKAWLDSKKFPDFNYPFHLLFRYSLALRDNQLEVALSIVNEDIRRAPVGMGFHPFWKRRLGPDGSDVVLTVPAKKMVPLKNAIPLNPARPVDQRHDLQQGKDLHGVDLDDCYTGLTRPKLDLVYKKPGIRVEYMFDPVFSHVVVYSPLDDAGNPGEFVAVEPVSHVTDGFNLLAQGWSETGVKILEPGETLDGKLILTIQDI